MITDIVRSQPGGVFLYAAETGPAKIFALRAVRCYDKNRKNLYIYRTNL